MSDTTHNFADLLAFRVHGMAPFVTHADSLDDRLAEASALLTVLETAFHVADDAQGHAQAVLSAGITELRPGIYARAFEGIRTLVNMANYHADNLRGA